MKLTISKEVLYARYLVHPVDDNGEVNYRCIEQEFVDEFMDEGTNYWRVETGGLYIDSIVDTVPYEQVKKYAEYLEGWLETHTDDDIITFNEWTRSDEYELSK